MFRKKLGRQELSRFKVKQKVHLQQIHLPTQLTEWFLAQLLNPLVYLCPLGTKLKEKSTPQKNANPIPELLSHIPG
jgi:hypothetical protein